MKRRVVNLSTGETQEVDLTPQEVEEANAPRVPSLSEYQEAIQFHIDAKAREKGYESGFSCSTYANSTNPAWKSEAEAFIAWRDAVWIYAYGELAMVASGQRSAPSSMEFIGELPLLAWE